MEEQLRYVSIPDFDPTQTIKGIFSDNLSKQTYGLYSLTYNSNDYNLILITLEKFVRSEKWETRYTVYQCISRVLQIYREIPIDSFLPYIIEGFEDKNDQVRELAGNCLVNFFHYIKPTLTFKISEIKKILKSGKTNDVINVLLFIHYQGWTGERLSVIIRKCLKHNKPIIQCCGGILLRHAYSNLHAQLSNFEATAKLANKINTDELIYFNSEIYELVDWIEKDMAELKIKLKPHSY